MIETYYSVRYRYGTMDGFSEYDLNGDGVIDPDEFRRGEGTDCILSIGVVYTSAHCWCSC